MTKHIHFLHDVEDLGAAYRCERCDYACATKTEMYEHRSGWVNECYRERVKQRFKEILKHE